MANSLKEKLLAGDIQFGMWLALASPAVAEIAAQSGFDWCVIDSEHGPSSIPGILDQLRALAGHDVAPVVRVPVGDDWMIKKVLDLGALSILVPLVNTGEDALSVVQAARYPPDGRRGYGAFLARAGGYGADPGYAARANRDVCVMVQVETVQALENLEAIATTDGVDVVFIGPADLAADMGYPGQPNATAVRDAIARANERLGQLGVVSGTVEFDPNRVSAQIRAGVGFLGVGGDSLVLGEAMRNLAAFARAQLRT